MGRIFLSIHITLNRCEVQVQKYCARVLENESIRKYISYPKSRNKNVGTVFLHPDRTKARKIEYSVECCVPSGPFASDGYREFASANHTYIWRLKNIAKEYKIIVLLAKKM